MSPPVTQEPTQQAPTHIPVVVTQAAITTQTVSVSTSVCSQPITTAFVAHPGPANIQYAPQPPASLYYSPSLTSVNAMYPYAPPCSIAPANVLSALNPNAMNYPNPDVGLCSTPKYVGREEGPGFPNYRAPVFTDPSALSALKSIDYYSGGPELEAFLDNVAAVAECLSWSDIQVFNAIKLKLRGSPQSLYYALPDNRRPKTTSGMRDWLVQLFGKRPDAVNNEREFQKLYRQKNETLRAYSTRLEIAAERIYPSMIGSGMASARNQVKREMLLIKQFLEGLDTRLANEICRYRQFETVEEALPYAEHCESVLARLFKETRADAQKHSIRALAVVDEDTPSRDAEPKPKTESVKLPANKSVDEASKKKRPPTIKLYPQMRGRCFNCGDTAHTLRECPVPRQDFCYACIKAGHRARLCPLNSNTVSTSTQRETV